MLRPLKLAALRILRGAGIFELVADSHWRGKRLLILCYHGTSLEDEYLWRPGLYMQPQTLRDRFSYLRKNQYAVLPLADALQRLQKGTLPRRSVVLTFDDGTYDFYRQALPLLREYGFPATVYLTTYYALRELPVFNLICSYMLWQRRGSVLPQAGEIGLTEPLDLRNEAGRHKVVRALMDLAERESMDGMQKDDLAAKLAGFLGVDYVALKAKRILQLMNRAEVQDVVAKGVDIQLHTHRHRMPEDESAFVREIRENRDYIHDMVAGDTTHFCYPGGVHRSSFLPWLTAERVVSATTCDAGLCSRHSDRLLLPRFVDNQNRTQLEFQSWATGVGDLLAFRKAASQTYVPRD